jgi:hypothetical protein
MPRNMSFAMTTEQVKNQTKTVTRRFGWWFLKPGDIICAVEKGMGLKKGDKVNRMGFIRVVSTRAEYLHEITSDDCVKEGFPNWQPSQFIEMICEHYRCSPREIVNRIEFEYVDQTF